MSLSRCSSWPKLSLHYTTLCPQRKLSIGQVCGPFDQASLIQENHAIAKMTARCAQYVSALKIVGLCKHKISRRLRKNLHITILISIRWGGEIIFKVFHPM